MVELPQPAEPNPFQLTFPTDGSGTLLQRATRVLLCEIGLPAPVEQGILHPTPAVRAMVKQLFKALEELPEGAGIPASLPFPMPKGGLAWLRENTYSRSPDRAVQHAAALLSSIHMMGVYEGLPVRAGLFFARSLADELVDRPVDPSTFAARAPFIHAASKESEAPHWAGAALRLLERRPEVSASLHAAAHRERALLTPLVGALRSDAAADAVLRLLDDEAGRDVLRACSTAAAAVRSDVSRVMYLCRKAGSEPDPLLVRDRLLHQLNAAILQGTPLAVRSLLNTDARLLRAASGAARFTRLDWKEVKEAQYESFVPAAALTAHPELLVRMRDLVEGTYPAGDAEEFTERYVQNPLARVDAVTCGGELAAFVGIEAMPGLPQSPLYVDWLCADPRTVSGLSTALLDRAMGAPQGTFHAIKPWSGVLAPMLNDLGGVCDGIPRGGRDGADHGRGDREYKDWGYVLTRRLPEDAEAYPVRSLGAARVAELLRGPGTAGLPERTVLPWIIDGREARICRVHFSNLEGGTQAGAEHDWFYKTVEREVSAGNVMTLYVPSDKGMICIFEPDAALPERRKELARVREARRRKHGSH